ncbi:hypothetical protein FWK35_00010654 [Aphis craccivora]|uniref:Uncharacterized protein n=1 Tax=Aphis craccivora TaxID=307492 RepID=A0A6G0YKW1_APHCR|nr:hypothetical protein FWK35_00010654 [Aphis craccivora]
MDVFKEIQIESYIKLWSTEKAQNLKIFIKNQNTNPNNKLFLVVYKHKKQVSGYRSAGH